MRSAVLLLLAALSLGATGDPPRTLEDCDELVRREPGSLDSYRCYLYVAPALRRMDDAARRMESLLSVDPENHRARLTLAYLDAMRGVEGAESRFRAAIDGFVSQDDGPGEVDARLSLAFFLVLRGRMEETDQELARAEELGRRLDDPPSWARIRVHQAMQANRRAEYSRSESLLKEVEPILFPDGHAPTGSQWLSAMGYIGWATGRYQMAADAYRRQADLLHRLGDLFTEAGVRYNLTLLAGHQVTATTPEMWELYEEALEVAVAAGNNKVQASCHLGLAGGPRSAAKRRHHARAALDLTTALEERLFARRLLGRSLTLEEPRDPEAGRRLIDEALVGARRAGRPHHVARALWVRAEVELILAKESGWANHGRQSALAATLAVLDAIESLRDLQIDAEARARTFSQWAFVYSRAAVLLADSQDPDNLDLAFRILERMRARILLDELDAARATATLDPSSPLVETRSGVLREIAQIQRRLFDGSLDEATSGSFLQDLEGLEAEEAALRAEIAHSDPRFASLRQPDLASLEELESALGANEALLSFQVDFPNEWTLENRSRLLIYTHHGTRIYPVLGKNEARAAVELLSGLLLNRDGSEVAGAVRLYDELLATALVDLPAEVNHLILIPDGPLHRLPFEVLREHPDAEPLGLRYDLTVVPSATMWLRWQQAVLDSPEEPALAFVDPDLAGLLGDVAAAASPERSAGLDGIADLGALPHAREEARALRRWLPGSRVLEGEEASERALKEADLRSAGILHLAAHALSDDEHPDRSAIVLTPGSDDQDGLLQIREIVDLDLDGRVVVLSACRSASGAILQGEGVMSLARGFFVAGAHAVVGSLWPLRDDEAATFFDVFYRHLGEGLSLAGALRAARRDRFEADAPAAAWSGVVLLGDGALVPFPGGARRSFPRGWLAALVAAVVLGGAATLWLSSRRRAH